jgi:predicted nucleotidyltransferase
MESTNHVRHAIEEILEKIITEYDPQKVILFGSYAYGRPDEESDIDLLIIKETDKRPIERWIELKRLLRDRSRMVAVSPLVYTPRELEERLVSRDFFIQEVLEKGKVLYGRS